MKFTCDEHAEAWVRWNYLCNQYEKLEEEIQAGEHSDVEAAEEMLQALEEKIYHARDEMMSYQDD